MLGKLLKYEIRATARLFLPLYLTIVVFAAINRFLVDMPNTGVAMAISMFIYVTLMIGLVLMTLLVMIQRFYKNLLGDEGYLMFTLPVQSWSHILSKLAVSMLWTVLSGIFAFCSIMFIASKNFSFTEFHNQLLSAYEQVTHYLGASAYLVGFESVLLILLSLASTILTIYAAIALGHLFSKHKLLASFGMYIVLKTIPQAIMSMFSAVFFSQSYFRIESHFIPSVLQINSILLVSLLYTGAVTAGYFILTNYILKRKLNLE